MSAINLCGAALVNTGTGLFFKLESIAKKCSGNTGDYRYAENKTRTVKGKNPCRVALERPPPRKNTEDVDRGEHAVLLQ